MYINFAKVDIDYWLYPQSYKYACVVAYPTHDSRPPLADGGISPPDGPAVCPHIRVCPGGRQLFKVLLNFVCRSE